LTKSLENIKNESVKRGVRELIETARKELDDMKKTAKTE
jgi:hypothetical protein